MTKKCIAPWIHIHTWPNNNVYPCCLTGMDEPVGSLNDSTLKEVWNNDAMKTIRLTMLDGKQPHSCRRCFEQEAVGQGSLRTTMNRNFEHHLYRWNETNPDGSLDNMDIVYWDFRFSNICNMRCRSCGPQLSTGWYEDTKKIWGSLPSDIPEAGRNVNMWEEVQPFFDKVEDIYFAGGEPLIMEEHYRILNQLVERNMFDTKLRYNTNFSQLKYKSLDVLDIWPKFDSVVIGASLDGFGPKAEYIRKGTDWSVIEHNRQQLRERAPNVEFFVNFTLSVQNAYHVVEFYDWAVDTGFIEPHQINFNLVQHPEHLRLQILPKHIKQELTELYSKRKGFESITAYMNREDRSNLIPEFKKQMSTVDKIRNENFAETFPELAELMQ